MQKLLIIALILLTTQPSWARCSKGYATADEAMEVLEAYMGSGRTQKGVSNYDLNNCKPLKIKRGPYSEVLLKLDCPSDTYYRTMYKKKKKYLAEFNQVDVSIFKLLGGICAGEQPYMVTFDSAPVEINVQDYSFYKF